MEELTSLVYAAQNGDLDAFDKIIKRFQDMAFAVAYARLGDRFLAEDAAQEAFIEAYLNLARLKEPAAFPGWLRTIVARQGNRLIRGKRADLVSLGTAATLSSPQPDPVISAEVQDMKDFVQETIQSLPENERQVTLLYYIADYSQKEIADFLGVRVSTVKSRLHTARNYLRERMIEMIAEELHNQRPSKDEAFAAKVIQFLRATELGKAGEVTALLEETPGLVHVTGPVSYSNRELGSLHIAASYDFQDIVDQLLVKGANINAKDNAGWSALHYVLARKNRTLAEKLLSQGAALDIFAAAQLGDLVRVETFLREQPELIQAKGPNGATPLHFAATVAVARWLLDQGAELEAYDNQQKTPLDWQAGNSEVASFLISRGAQVNDIFLACAVGDLERARALLDTTPELIQARSDDRQDTPLNTAAYFGQVEIARLLLERGADVNANQGVGAVTPLHDAAMGGHGAMVRLLVERGADLEARDGEFNSTPLQWAKFFKREVAIAVLEELKHKS